MGLALGVAGCLATHRLLSPLLFEVDPFDPWITAAVVGGLSLISLLALLLPARQATSIQPVAVLRND